MLTEFTKLSSVKIHEYLFSGIQDVACGQADITMVTGAYQKLNSRYFANARFNVP
jgi:hypothetical protein